MSDYVISGIDEKIIDDVVERAQSAVEDSIRRWTREGGRFLLGNTPIERGLFAAVFYEIAYNSFIKMLVTPDMLSDETSRSLIDFNQTLTYVEPQVTILDWPVDFLFHLGDAGDIGKCLVVECDGHDYHERTKEQAARDRSRDRRLQEAGYTVFRFTGSEIWRGVSDCADAIVRQLENKVFL